MLISRFKLYALSLKTTAMLGNIRILYNLLNPAHGFRSIIM